MALLSRYLPAFLSASVLLVPAAAFGQASINVAAASSEARSEATDPEVISRIKDEGMNRSQVMNTLSYLTDVIGPRLTGSPGLRRAQDWTMDRMKEWGLQNVSREAWGPFGRGWELKRFSAQVVAPQVFPLIGYPKAWSPGVKGGSITADVVRFTATNEAGLEPYKGKLKNKIVLVGPVRELAAHFTPQGRRWTDEELATMAQASATPPGPALAANRRRNAGQAPTAQRPTIQFAGRRMQFLLDEGAALILDTSSKGDGGTLFVQSAIVAQLPDATPQQRLSAWQKEAEKRIVPQVMIAAEHFNRLARMLAAGEKVRLSVNLETAYPQNEGGKEFNVVGEIPGGDKKDEVVMAGAHMDSWHSATGATDNGAGTAVCLEAVRILKALGVQPRRTIRVALWSGEEQGIFGSSAYVIEHFGRWDGEVFAAKPEHAKLSAYFNLDNGTGKIRGVFTQGNEAIAPIFKEWLAPFAEMGATTVTLRNTGSTDHVPFDRVGLPGFQFIQDPIEYSPRTHHSNQDSFDRIQGEDMKQASVIMATFLYNAAMRDDLLPRKPMK